MQFGFDNPLESLIAIGRLSAERVFLGHKFRMQVLNSGEQKDVLENTGDMDAIARMRALQHETMARSIKAIDGQKIIVSVPDEDEGRKIRKQELINQNLRILKKVSQPVMDGLYNEYLQLVKEQETMVGELKKKSEKSGQEQDGESEKK